MWIESVSSLLVAGGAIWGASVAHRGLGVWRDQLRGSAEYKAARRFLRTALRLREALRAGRSPLITPGESSRAASELKLERQPGEDIFAFQSRCSDAAYELRWGRVVEAWQAFQAEAIEVEVLWGKESRSRMDTLNRCVNRYYSAAVTHLDSRSKPGAIPSDLVLKAHRDLYDTGTLGSPDEFAVEIDRGVEAVEELIRPHLRTGR